MIVCFALATNNCYNTKSLLGPVQIKSPFTPDMNLSFLQSDVSRISPKGIKIKVVMHPRGIGHTVV